MNLKDVVFVGMDCGSGNVATVMETKGFAQARVTPSFVRYVPGVMKETDGDSTWVTHGDDGQESTFVVQSRAVDAVDTRTKEYQLSPACRVLVINELVRLGLAGKKVIIADTLPADQYYDDNNSVNRTQINLKRESLLKEVRNVNPSIKSPVIVDVQIMPEAVTAYNAALYLEDGEINPQLDGVEDCVIIDIGRYTVDFAHLDCNTHTIYKRHTSDQGVHVLLSRIKVLMLEAAQDGSLAIPADVIRNLSIDDVDALARNGFYGSPVAALKHKRISIDHLVSAAAASYANDIRYMASVVVPQHASAHALIMAGGGMYLIGGKLRNLPNYVADWHDNLVIPHQPETAIARGAYEALRASYEEETEGV